MVHGHFMCKLLSSECHRTSLMISQNCFWWWLGSVRWWAITWANVNPYLCHHTASLGHSGKVHLFPGYYITYRKSWHCLIICCSFTSNVVLFCYHSLTNLLRSIIYINKNFLTFWYASIKLYISRLQNKVTGSRDNILIYHNLSVYVSIHSQGGILWNGGTLDAGVILATIIFHIKSYSYWIIYCQDCFYPFTQPMRDIVTK